MRRRIGAATFVAAILALVPNLGNAGDEHPLSPAQIALFESDHLHAVADKEVLTYAYEHHGGAEGDFSDHVTEKIRGVNDNGTRNVEVTFLTGKHAVDYRAATTFRGNPLLIYFLEHDVVEMHQATRGAALYFRNRIREAFLEQAQTRPVSFTFEGKAEKGTEITVTPFRKDPMIDRFPAFAEKTYHFILSDAIPGTIYEISTTLPKADGDAGTFTESVTYTGEQR